VGKLETCEIVMAAEATEVPSAMRMALKATGFERRLVCRLFLEFIQGVLFVVFGFGFFCPSAMIQRISPPGFTSDLKNFGFHFLPLP